MLAPREVPGKSKDGTRVVALRHVGLGPELDVFPSKRSGGQQRRMAIDYALTMSTEYILIDEVTSALQLILVCEVRDTLRMLSRKCMTMICLTRETPLPSRCLQPGRVVGRQVNP
jgi:ABC-type polar amino acid transport system ATPase subunit